MDFADLKNKNQEELNEILKKTQAELRLASAKAKLGQLKQNHTVKNLRVMIARIKTILAK